LPSQRRECITVGAASGAGGGGDVAAAAAAATAAQNNGVQLASNIFDEYAVVAFTPAC